MQEEHYDIAIVGAGIVGLAHALAAAKKGFKVAVFERNTKAFGASIRNFGLSWPVGQKPDRMERALRSRQIWIDLSKEANFWVKQNGSLHLAYHQDELDVMTEFYDNMSSDGYQCELLSAVQVIEKSPVVNKLGLLGGLWSNTEMTVNPREAILKIATFLSKIYQVTFHYETLITEINYPYLSAGSNKWQADKIIVCSGSDFESLYPVLFSELPITKCKLQMMKALASDDLPELGPTLCAGLTLRHYAAFEKCPSLDKLRKRYDTDFPEYKKWGIHVLLAQNNAGELIIGDSHEYAISHDPFIKEDINEYILTYLKTFTNLKKISISERWIGIYPSLKNDDTELVINPEEGVTIVNGLGGAGMTLSFGLAEENMNNLLKKQNEPSRKNRLS